MIQRNTNLIRRQKGNVLFFWASIRVLSRHIKDNERFD